MTDQAPTIVPENPDEAGKPDLDESPESTQDRPSNSADEDADLDAGHDADDADDADVDTMDDGNNPPKPPDQKGNES